MIRAHIAQRHLLDAIDVYIVDHDDGHMRFLHVNEDTQIWNDLGREDEALTGEPPPTFTLPGDSGRALLEALVHHYQGTEDTRALRRDYDAERKRVDTQAQTIALIAQALAAQGGFRG